MTGKVQKLMTTYTSPGTNQLNEFIGKPQVGDTCQIHIIGNVIPKTPRKGFFSCIPESTEFIDTNHILKRVTIEVGRKGYDGLYRGLHEAVQDMNFGDDATFWIPSELGFGKQGLSKATMECPQPDHANRNPVPISFRRIEPDQDLEVQITLFRLCREGQWHNRKIRNKPAFYNAAWATSM